MTQSIIGKTCPYCQYPIKQSVEFVSCNSCKVPHHRECWEENGGCTTFGCKETSFRTPNQGVVDISLEESVSNRPPSSSSSGTIYFFVGALIFLFFIFWLFINLSNSVQREGSSTSTTQQAAQQESQQTTRQAEVVTYYVITSQGYNLFIRKSPGRDNKSSSDVITRLPRGTKLRLVDNHGNSVRRDGFTWWEVKVLETGTTGWVASEYISTNANDVYK